MTQQFSTQFSTSRWPSYLAGFLIVILVPAYALAAEDDDDDEPSPFQVGLYIDTFYQFDVSRPTSGERPPVLFAYGRHGEFSVNLAVLEASYEHRYVRAHMALMTGTYSEDNLAAEPQIFRNVYEGVLGVRLWDQVWVDAGIFSSHLGFDSATTVDNLTLSTSLLADSTPYYFAGVSIAWNPNQAWLVRFIVSNGWQNIRETPGNTNKGFGHQVTWEPTDGLLINSSSFFNTEGPDDAAVWRLFHNFYMRWQPARWLETLIAFDMGAQERIVSGSQSDNNIEIDGFDIWYGAAAIARFWLIHQQLALAARVETFRDPYQVVTDTGNGRGLETVGYSLNVDVLLYELVWWRTEGRILHDKHPVYSNTDQELTELNVSILTSLAVRLNTGL